MKAVLKCPATVFDVWGKHICSRGATHEHDGRYYCKSHHPPTVAAKIKARNEAWEEKFAREAVELEAKLALAREQERRAALFPEMLTGLQIIADSEQEDSKIGCIARALVAKATGKP